MTFQDLVRYHLIDLTGEEFASRHLPRYLPSDADSAEGVFNLEALAFYVYTTAFGFHHRINSELWAGAPSETAQFFATVINEALPKLPLYMGRIYRGYTPTDFVQFVDSYQVGSEKIWLGLTSCAMRAEEAFSGSILFDIAPQNARLTMLQSAEWQEGEVMLRSGARIRVVSVERRGDTAYIVVKEI